MNTKIINNEIIDKAFEFYNIDTKYKEDCYICAKEINNNKVFKEAFKRVYEDLYTNDFSKVQKIWDINEINDLFVNDIPKFVTNLMIILGYNLHKKNLNKYELDEAQINIHKKRVKECFENDLINRGYKGIRISQMLWAVYFIRIRIIEIGMLQYEYYLNNDDYSIIKIHIPKGTNFDISLVKKSLDNSKVILKNIFDIDKIQYVCNSWLLSNQVFKLLDNNSNIYKFHELFNVKDGEECLDDILDFVYEINKCKDYTLLAENTTLQRRIKEELLKENKFHLGKGVLK